MRGRIRSIKPEVHLDEELWDLEQRTTLPIFRAFTGLWNQADREGRFEWRPRALKAAILPYWEGDFGAVLEQLAASGFVTRYEVEGKIYGHVRTFGKHQSINHKEEASRLPGPPVTREPRVPDASATREERVPISPVGKGTEGNGRERKGGERRVPDATRDEHAEDPPPEPANDNGRRLRSETSSSHVAEWDETLRALCYTRKRAVPRMASQLRWQTVEHVRDIAETHSRTFHEAAQALAEAALDAPEKRFTWVCLESDPFAENIAPDTGVRRGGFVPPSPSSSFGPPTDLSTLFGAQDDDPEEEAGE